MVASVRPSTVALRIDDHGRSSTTGLVAESGGIIVTPSQALSGAKSITAIEPDGTREPATVVAVDQTSGLAVLRIDDDLPAATFDDDDLPVGAIAVAATLKPGTRAHPAPRPSSTPAPSSRPDRRWGANEDNGILRHRRPRTTCL